MNSNTPPIKNTNSSQNTSTSNKTALSKKNTELDFNDLFSSALGQSGPKSQVNFVESQLTEKRLTETRFKQQENKPSDDHNPNADAAQAAVWAQRQWMQNNSGSQEAETNSESIHSPSNSKNTLNTESVHQQNSNETPAKPSSESDSDVEKKNIVNNVSESAQSTDPQSDEITEKKIDIASVSKQQANENKIEVVIKNELDKQITKRTDSENLANIKNIPESLPDETNLKQNSTFPVEGTKEVPSLQTVNLSEKSVGKPELPSTQNTTSTINNLSSDQKITPLTLEEDESAKFSSQNRTLENIKTEAISISTSTIETKTLNSNISNNNNNNVVNQSNSNFSANTNIPSPLTPQIAQQIESLSNQPEVTELKVGQKILATSSLQNSNPTETSPTTALNSLQNNVSNPSSSVQIKTPVNQPGFTKALGQTIHWAIGKNLSTVDIRVNPETFGPINMRVIHKGQQVQLIIRTQDETSANMLTQALSGLKEAMAQNGLQLNHVQIQQGNTNSSQNQTSNGQTQFDQHNRQGDHNRQQKQSQSGTSFTNEPVQPSAPITPKKPEGTLDLFA
jgi:flagellar hook-length control protein FliK